MNDRAKDTKILGVSFIHRSTWPGPSIARETPRAVPHTTLVYPVSVATTMMPPTTMNRARSEADRWRLVREFETSFQQVTVSPTGAGQATVLSSSGSRSWFPRRGSNTAQVDLYNDDYEEDDKSVGTHGSGHKHKHGSRVVSKHNTRKKDDRSSPSQQSMAAMTLSSPARSTASIRSSRRLGPQKQYSSKSVIQVSKRRPVEYDLSDWADPMRTPSPVAFIERKSSFFGRTWFAAPKPDTTSVPMSLAGFEPIIPQQSQSLPRQKSTFFARNNKASTSNMPGQPFENKPEAAHTEPPLMARSSSIFTKLFPRKRTPKYMDFSAPTTTAPSFQSDKETESEGSYEYDEEIAMASTSFDLTLPDQLLSEHQKSNRVVPDEDKYNPVDRWSPSPVPAEHAPEHMINITHNAHAPKRPIRQQSLKHNFDDDPLTPPALKTNLLQEREELLQQMKRVDHLLQGLMDDDAEHPPGETKAAEPTELVEHQKRQHPTLELDDNGRHEDAMDDDDSTYSMLSGIIASWMAERDAATLKSSCKGATNKGRLSVRFDSIIVREYERVVGDNPSCSSGREYKKGVCARVIIRINNY